MFNKSIHQRSPFPLIKFLLLFVLSTTCNWVAAANHSGPGPKDPLIIVHMTDPQFGFKTNNADFKFETVNFEKVIHSTNKLKPHAIVITGDLTHRINDPDQIAEYKRILKLLDPAVKVYQLPGNHDLPDNFTMNDLKAYRSHYGKDYYSFQTKDMFGLALNSQMIASGSNVAEEYENQYNWMLASLRKAKRKGYAHIAVFQHHPYFVQQVEEKDEYFNIPTKYRKKYLDLFKEYGVKFVFTGHLHYRLQQEYQGINILTAGPIANSFKEQNPGVQLLKIDADRIQHQFYSLDEYENLTR